MYPHTYPLLRQLARFLILQIMSTKRTQSVRTKITYLGIPQQLQNSSLIRRESSNLSDYRPHKFSFCRCNSLAVTGPTSLRDGCRGVAFVLAVAKIYSTISSANFPCKSHPILTASNHFLELWRLSLTVYAKRSIPECNHV